MKLTCLIEQLKTIPDWRRGRAVQYPLWLLLLTSLLGVMSGYTSLRGLADFMERHQQEVAEYFDLAKGKLPSYCTIRRMMRSVDTIAVARVFRDWAQAMAPVATGDAVALDGQALASTVRDAQGTQQDFVMVVSACVQSWAGVIGQTSFQNAQESEIGAVRELLAQLDLHGVWVTLDALHAQKNS